MCSILSRSRTLFFSQIKSIMRYPRVGSNGPAGSDQVEITKMNENEVRHIWRMADAVCFDVDSTVVREEGIDELAKYCGKGDQVAELTRNAMKGKSDFRSALSTRLNLIQPTLQELQTFIEDYPATLTPGIKDLVDRLHDLGTHVYLVSGGFRRFIRPIAEEFNIPNDRVYANLLNFEEDGTYEGFDLDEPTSRSGGKGEVISILKKKYGYKNIVMIGDGATDLEASPPASAFIGFGGNVVRDPVKQKAKWYVTSFKELEEALR